MRKELQTWLLKKTIIREYRNNTNILSIYMYGYVSIYLQNM